MTDYTFTAIADPVKQAEVPPAYVNEPMVKVEETRRIHIKMMYPLLGMKEGYQTCYVRKSVAAMLEKAALLLPEGIGMEIWDAWRPFALQKELFVTYSADIIKEFHLENMNWEEQTKFISQFVADPVEDRLLPPAHTTGGAVDLTLINEEGKELSFGTAFDAFNDRTETVWYEHHPENEEIMKNRRLLYGVMTSVGFTNLPSEWWHYEYGDRNWSTFTGKPAMYAGLFADNEFDR